MGREEQENEGTTSVFVCWHAHVRTHVFDPHDMTCTARPVRRMDSLR